MIGIIWEGVDGSVWDLRNGPVRLTEDAPSGLGSFESEAFTRETPTTDGATLLSVRRKPRTIDLPVMINVGFPPDAWQAWDRSWWKSLSEEEYGTLHVTDTLGDVRSIALRFSSDNGYAPDRDPSAAGVSAALCTLVADDPWFRGQEVRFEVQPPPPPVDFFGSDGAGPPFYISSGGTIDATEIGNTGDADAWPIWEFWAPTTHFTAAVDGHEISGSIDIGDGQKLVIDTRPTRKTARLYTGDEYVSVMRQLDSFDFGRIPRGQIVPVRVSVVGSGLTVLRFEPLYKRGY